MRKTLRSTFWPPGQKSITGRKNNQGKYYIDGQNTQGGHDEAHNYLQATDTNSA